MPTNLELLRSIQDGAVSSEMPVGELLRRCQMLAARLKVPELGAWVQHELNGYQTADDLPDYRIVPGVAKGHFTGPFGSGLRNGILPANNLPEMFRGWAREARFTQPIAALEEIARSNEQDVRCAWPGDLVALVQQEFYEHLVLAQAWLSVSRTSIVAAVETVRNRILTFSLEAEEYVDTEDPKHGAPQSQALSQVFNTVVYGQVGNLAQASSHFTQNSGVPAGDLSALLRELERIGVPESDAGDLQAAITEDGAPTAGKFGPRVAGWVGKMIGKAMSGAWQVTSNTATTLLPQLIAHFYGLPT